MAQSPQTIAAFIAAAASLIVALISYLGKRKSDRELAQLNAELIETQERRKAQRDYEYEARKRLYSELQPLLFQLVEASDNAYWRIQGLARSAREGRLTGRSSRLRAQSRNYLPSTVYRLMVRLCCSGSARGISQSSTSHLNRRFTINTLWRSYCTDRGMPSGA